MKYKRNKLKLMPLEPRIVLDAAIAIDVTVAISQSAETAPAPEVIDGVSESADYIDNSVDNTGIDFSDLSISEQENIHQKIIDGFNSFNEQEKSDPENESSETSVENPELPSIPEEQTTEQEATNILLYETEDNELKLINDVNTPLNIETAELTSNNDTGLTLSFVIKNEQGEFSQQTLAIESLSFVVPSDDTNPVIIIATPEPDSSITVFDNTSIQIHQFVFSQWDADNASDLSEIQSNLNPNQSVATEDSDPPPELEIEKNYAFINIDSIDSFSGIDDLFVNHSEVTELESESYSFLVVAHPVINQNFQTNLPQQSLLSSDTGIVSFAAITTPLPDLTVNEDAPNTVIDLSVYFSDPDGTVTYTVESNSDMNLVETTINDNFISLDFLDNQNGEASILIRATDTDSSFVEDSFTVTVNAIADPPIVENPIDDITVDEDANDTVINLDNVFTDPDILTNSDLLTYEVFANTNNSLVSTSINGNELTLDYLDHQNGQSTIIIQATDQDGNSVLEAFNVTVNAVADQPIVENPIGIITVNEDAETTFIDLGNVFFDGDVLTNNDHLTYEVISNDNTGLLTTIINEDQLIINYLENQNGEASIVVRATDLDNNFIEDSFIVTVNPVSDSPTVENTIADFTVNEDAPDTTINLDNVFTDIDILTNGDSLTYQVVNNTNENLVTASINGNILTLDYLENQNGIATIIIRATDLDNNSVLDAFEVTVTPVEDQPIVENPIGNLIVDEDANDTVINLDNVFFDGDIADNNDSLTYQFISNSNENLIEVSLNGNELTLGYLENQNGEATIVVRATDLNGNLVEETFSVTVNPVSDAPFVAMQVPNVFVDEDASSTIINLDNIFGDIDIQTNGDSLSYDVSAPPDPALVTASINGNELTLNYVENQNGRSGIFIRATDSDGLFALEGWIVVVRSVPDAPFAENPITSVTVNEDAESTIVNLDTVFNDVDIATDGDFLTYQLIGNTNENLVTVSLDENTNEITLDYLENQNGIATISVEATDSFGLSFVETFDVIVNPVSDPPEIQNPIPNFTVNENAPDTVITLDNVFFDLDIQTNNETLTYQVISNTNQSLVTASVTGNELSLNYQLNQTGKTIIDIRATDSSGNFIDDSFIVTVGSIIDNPVVQNPIADFTVNEDASDTVINLDNVFSDNDALTYQVFNNTSPELVSVSINGNLLTLSYAENANGQATIQIEALDPDLNSIYDSFVVTVDPVPDPPNIENPIADFAVDEDADSTVINLDDVFSDIDMITNSDSLTYQVFNNTNTSLISTSIDTQLLTLDYLENQNGNAIITIRATDTNGLSTDHSFEVTVNPINDRPSVQNPIGTLTVTEGADSTVINLDNVFTDIDILTNNDTLTYIVFLNEDPTLVNATINENLLTLDYLEGQTGDVFLSIRALDNTGIFGQDRIHLIVTSDPIVENPIVAITVNEDAADTIINLDTVFADNGPLTYEVVSNNNTSLLSINITNNELTLSYFENQNGVADIVLEATDTDGNIVQESFQVIVNSVADNPFVETPISDIQVDENANDTIINLDNIFSDIDILTNNDILTYEVTTNTNETLVAASISGNELTLDYLDNQSGNATIVITATDSNGNSVQDAFEITVNSLSVNEPPIVENPIGNFQVEENANDTVINLDNVFSDNEPLTYELVYNNNTGLINASINGNLLTLDYTNDQNGEAYIVIRATDSDDHSVQDAFEVTVTPFVSDDFPTVENPIQNIQVNVNASDTVINLDNVFSDNGSLTYTIFINTNINLINASISGNELTIEYLNNQTGEATVIVQATDSENQTVLDAFDIVVGSASGDLVVEFPIGDLTVNEDANSTVIDLSNVFSSSNSLTYTITVNNNPGVVNASINGNLLTLEYLENQSGIALIAIDASDSINASVQDVFQVTVVPVADIPTLINPLSNITVNEDAADTIINLDNVFEDPDVLTSNDSLTLTIFSNNNPELVNASIEGSNLRLSYLENQNGNADITIRTIDLDGNFADTSFSVLVNPVPDLPIINTPLPDITILPGVQLTEIDLSTYITSVDGANAPMTITVDLNTNESLVSTTVNGSVVSLNTSGSGGGISTITLKISSSSDTFVTSNMNITVVPPIIDIYNPPTETPDPIQEETPDPIQEDNPEPVQEETPEPVQEESPEPIQEENPEPVQQQQTEPETDQASATLQSSSQQQESQNIVSAFNQIGSENTETSEKEFNFLASTETFSSYNAYPDLRSVFGHIEGSKIFLLNVENEHAELIVVPEDLYQRDSYNFSFEKDKASIATVGKSTAVAFSGFNVTYLKLRADTMIAFLGEYVNKSKITLQTDHIGSGHASPSFIIKLHRQPTANVTLEMSFSIENLGIISPNSLTFTPENWDIEQRVELIIKENTNAYSNVYMKIQSDDSYYQNIDSSYLSFNQTSTEQSPILAIPLSSTKTESNSQSISISILVNDINEVDATSKTENCSQETDLSDHIYSINEFEFEKTHTIEYDFYKNWFNL